MCRERRSGFQAPLALSPVEHSQRPHLVLARRAEAAAQARLGMRYSLQAARARWQALHDTPGKARSVAAAQGWLLACPRNCAPLTPLTAGVEGRGRSPMGAPATLHLAPAAQALRQPQLLPCQRRYGRCATQGGVPSWPQ